MIKINLLPVREKIREANIRRQVFFGVLLVIIVIVVMGVAEIQNRLRIHQLQERKETLSNTLDSLKREVGDLSRIEKQKKDLQQRRDTIVQLTQNLLGTVRAVDKLAQAKPDVVYFTKLDQRNMGAPWEDFTLVVKGVAMDNEVVAQFMRNLEKVELFQAVELNYTKSKRVKGVGLTFQEFQLSVLVSTGQRMPPTGVEGTQQKKTG